MSDETTAISINGVQDGGEKPKLSQTPSPAAIISELRGAIDWHPLGAKGPWHVGPVDDTVVTAFDGSEIAAIDGDYNAPDICPTKEVPPTLDADDIIDGLLSDMHEDADVDDLNGVDAFFAAVKAFNEAQTTRTYWADETRKIRVPAPAGGKDHG